MGGGEAWAMFQYFFMVEDVLVAVRRIIAGKVNVVRRR